MRLSLLLAPLLALSAIAASPAAAQSDCSHYALVSGYHSNVHVYDGCSGAFLRTLDPQLGRLRGPQAVKLGPDGHLWVVSELTAQVHTYRADDFAYVATPIEVGAGFGLTGIAFRGDDVYASGYESSTVRRYRSDGTLRDTPVAASAGARGPDNGMAFGPDGQLYIPGYDSHNIVRHDPVSGQSAVLVAAASGGLRNARGILFRPDGATFLVSAEGSGQILEFRRSDGGFVRELARGLSRPTGLDWAPDGALAVVTNLGVFKLDPATGAQRSTLVGVGSGGLAGPTYIAFIAKAAAVDRSQVGSQFWVSGAGRLEGRRVLVDALYSSTGATFGSAFDPADIVAKRWGALDVEFTSCTSATLRWTSSGADSAGFGDGGYALTRFLPGPGTQRCEQAGFANAAAEDWLQGTWWGGEARSGEGFIFEYVNASTVVATWFTHRPAE